MSSDTFASSLVQARASHSRENGTLLVLKFDRNQPISLQEYTGNSITLITANLEPGNPNVSSEGYIRQVDVEQGRINIHCSTYVKARLIQAGTGTYILQLQKTTAPKVSEETKVLERPVTQSYQREAPQEQPDRVTDSRDDGSQTILQEDLENTYRPVDSEQNVTIPPTIKLAIQLASQGESGRAIGLLNSIQPSDADYPWSRFAIGKIYEQNGEVSRALDKYRQALIYPETESIAAVHIALAFQAMGNAESAISMWERVLQLSGGELNLQEGESADTVIEVLETSDKAPSFIERFQIYLIILGGAILLATGVFLFFFIKNRSRKMGDLDEFGMPSDMYDEDDEDIESAGPKVAKMYKDQQDVSEDDEDEDLDSQIAELDKLVGESMDMDSDEELFAESSLSDTKVKKVQTLHEQGATVREIAETLGIGQDEVRMAINLSEA